jgi:hypothetical protein
MLKLCAFVGTLSDVPTLGLLCGRDDGCLVRCQDDSTFVRTSCYCNAVAQIVTGGWCLQGNCSTPPPDAAAVGIPPAAAPLRSFLPGQCLIATDSATFYVWGQSLWLDNLYVRVRQRVRGQFTSLVTVSTGSYATALWVTNCMFQGDGNGVRDCEGCGMSVEGGSVYVEGDVFKSFNNTI